ncbi:MAG: thermonuclease family protein, partial [Candidatus Binatia bacterium]
VQEKLCDIVDDSRSMIRQPPVSIDFLEQSQPLVEPGAAAPQLFSASQPTPRIDPRSIKFGSVISAVDREGQSLSTVREILGVDRVRLDTGAVVRLLGVKPCENQEVTRAALAYLEERVRRKKVILRFDPVEHDDAGTTPAYVFLKNRIFVNAELIKAGMAMPSRSPGLRYAATFDRCLEEAKRLGLGAWAVQRPFTD